MNPEEIEPLAVAAMRVRDDVAALLQALDYSEITGVDPRPLLRGWVQQAARLNDRAEILYQDLDNLSVSCLVATGLEASDVQHPAD